MKMLTCIIAVLLSTTVAAQRPNSIGIVHKREKYYLTKSCYDVIQWEEVALIDKRIQNKINSVIREVVLSYKEGDASLLCDKESNYSAVRKFKVAYAQKGIVSYHLEANIYYKGILHNFHSFNTLNFNAATGEQITLDSLIDPVQFSNLYNLIVTKIDAKTEIDGLDSLDLKGQLAHQNFLITNGGIKMLYLLRSYPMEVTLTFQELKSVANKNSFLQRLDGR